MNRFKTIVEIESQKEYYQKLHQIIEKEYETKTIYPPKQEIFRALNLCDFDDVKAWNRPAYRGLRRKKTGRRTT